MQISEIMHKGVSAVNIKESVRRVAELMRQEDIGAVPVMEDERPVGFVTDRDIVISCVAEGYNLNESISHAMNEDVYCVTQVEEATKLMQENQVSRVLVVDQNQRPVGMVSLQDITQSRQDDECAETLSRIKQ
jgi:predicted transcriptional regulator